MTVAATTPTFAPKAGDHFKDLSSEAYHGGPGISASQLARWASDDICPAYWLHDEQNPKQPSEDMLFGTAVHRLALEPQLFHNTYAVWPNGKKRWVNKEKEQKTADFNAFCAEHPGCIELTETCFDDVRRCADGLNSSAFFRDLVGREPLVESSFYAEDPETGLLVKTRPDAFAGIEVDIKTARNSDPKWFSKQEAKLGYGLKAAFHMQVLEWCLGERPAGFVWVVINRKYCIPEFYPVDDARLALGNAGWRQALTEYAECRQSGHFPSFTEERLRPLPLEKWRARQLESLVASEVA